VSNAVDSIDRAGNEGPSLFVKAGMCGLMTNLPEGESSSTFFTTTYPYGLRVVETSYTAGSSPFSLAKRILSNLLNSVKTVLLNTLRLSWEAANFVLHYLLFIQAKTVAFVYFLEDTKDIIVRTLMWRRGLLFRPATHGGVMIIASVALLVGSLFKTAIAPTDFTRDTVMAAQNTPETIIPEGRPRSEVIKYAIKEGDSVSTIAAAYNVSIDSIKWANNLDRVEEIKPGDTLSIPPVAGVIHKVAAGDTISSVASKYEADSQTIVDYPFNYIDDSLALNAGQTLIIPGGKIPPPKPVYRGTVRQLPLVAGGSGLFAWPVAGGISQSPSWWHPAVDIAAPYSTPIYAAAPGSVTFAGYSSYGFGNYIMISHDGGYTSAYAHLSAIHTQAGQVVAKGQLIGAVGCTGRCTGPHLHFEIRRDGAAVNPLSLLP
jgi:murein DD-endopeptidase MepM/ murein hydrolase activator NlpD